MRTFGKSILALGALCLLAGQAHAQGRGGMGMGGIRLYTNKSVQKELKLTEDQTKKVNETVADLGEKYQDRLQEARSSQDFPQMQKLNQEMVADARKALADTLKPEQSKRFGEIALQQMGVQAFGNPMVMKTIKLTDDQTSKVTTLQTEMRDKMMELRQGFQDDREGTMKKMADLRTEMLGKAVALLTDDQKKSWKDMIGEPFEVKPDPQS